MSEELSIEDRARQLGWSDKEHWRGDPDKWQTAEAFVETGEKILPIVRANLKKTLDELHATKAQVNEMKVLLDNSQEAIQALKEYQSEETKRQVDLAVKEVRAQLLQARRDGDVDAELQLSEQLDDLRLAQREAKAPPPPPPAAPPATPGLDPELQAFISENPWFGKDVRRTNMFLAEGVEMRQDPTNASLVGRAFYSEALKRADDFLQGRSSQAPASKVEGGAPSRSSGGGGGGSKSFSSLPPDAQQAANALAVRLVGPNRAFPDVKAWQAHYAAEYYRQEQRN